MTQIDFYTQAGDRLHTACRLAAKARSHGLRVTLYCPDHNTAKRLDQLLWTVPATGFLPDAVADGHFNALSGKIMVRPRPEPRRHRAPSRLAALFHLGDPDDDTITEVSSARLNGLQLARTLMSSAMDTRYAGSSRMEHQMRFVARVADVLPVHALRYPRTVAALDGVAREIRRIIGP